MKNKLKTSILQLVVLLGVIVLSGCDDEEPPVVVTPKPEPTAFFNLTDSSYWQLQDAEGQIATFRVEKLDSISLAMRYWDTIEYNRKQVLATPISFNYRENGVGKKLYLALIEEDSSFILATRLYRFLANYQLNHYVYLFKIPKAKPALEQFIESDSVLLPVGTDSWLRNYSAKWTKSGDLVSIADGQHSIWTVEYSAYDQYHVPQFYASEFAFAEGVGFYKYMGYTLIEAK